MSAEPVFRILGKILIPVAVYGVFALARRYMRAPARLPRDAASPPVEDLTDRFRSTKWLVGSAMVCVAIVFAWSSHAALVWLNHYFSLLQSAEGMRLWPQSAIWWFFPGFGAICLCWEITLLIWEQFGNREEALLYDRWNSQRAGFDCRRVLRWMALLIVLPIGILTLLAIPMHSTLRETDIIECGYAFSGCHTYAYAEATRLTQVDGFRSRDGKLNERAGILVDFRGGRRWSSAEWSDWSAVADPELGALLARKTGLALQHATAEEDIH